MVQVKSTNLRAVDYNLETHTLIIQFHGGLIYAYYNVPQSIFEGLMSASSKGRFHHKYIKPYPYRRLR